MIGQLDKCLREASTLDGVLEFRNEHFWTIAFGTMVCIKAVSSFVVLHCRSGGTDPEAISTLLPPHELFQGAFALLLC